MRRTLPWAVALLGLLLVAGGVAVFVVGSRPADFGWSAYAPLPPVPDAYRSGLQLTFDDGPAVLWTRTAALGAGIVGAGLLVLAGLVGWVVGLRSARNSTG
jgi:hypothetical protein